MSTVRVRYAPSPTGYQHVGGARTALYNYLFARQNKGVLILRIEDTDVERSTEESLRMVLQDLADLGLSWEEGPEAGSLQEKGSYGPYRQSQRGSVYQKLGAQLIEQGKAYHCFMTEEETEIQKRERLNRGEPPQVQSPYRDWSPAEAKKLLNEGKPAVVRFKVSTAVKEYQVKDLIRGEVNFPSDMVGDFVLLRSDGMPVYNFCCAVDDALMKITHVLRAEEHLSNTVRQLMIYEALGFTPPQFGHLSIILGADRQKLSKRHGATSVHEYLNSGFMPEALNNFIALLGWSSPKAEEILSMADMVEQFGLDRLHAAAAVFDEQKLRWMNSVHLRNLKHPELFARIQPYLVQAGIQLTHADDPNWVDRAMGLFKTSMVLLSDAVELLRPFDGANFKVSAEAAEVLGWPKTKPLLSKWLQLLGGVSSEYIEAADFDRLQTQIKTEVQVKGKELFQPIRVAVVGKPEGAELKHVVPLLKVPELRERAEIAQKSAGGN